MTDLVALLDGLLTQWPYSLPVIGLIVFAIGWAVAVRYRDPPTLRSRRTRLATSPDEVSGAYRALARGDYYSQICELYGYADHVLRSSTLSSLSGLPLTRWGARSERVPELAGWRRLRSRLYELGSLALIVNRPPYPLLRRRRERQRAAFQAGVLTLLPELERLSVLTAKGAA